MIGIILAGGYAKRLWPLTVDRPKPLLPVGTRLIIDYSLDAISSLDSIISKVIVLTNSTFQRQFREWAQGKKPQNITILSDGSLSEKQKPGAIGALVFMSSEISDDFLVIAGDCIYPSGLKGLLAYFHDKRAPVVGVYQPEVADQLTQGSAVELGINNTIVSFREKPDRATTNLAGAAVYAFPERIKNRLLEYSELGLREDEPGRFIEWLHKKETVYGYLLEGGIWDIGTKEAYEKALSHIRDGSVVS
jgi:glucose-1-phosphate thymidylyltransferase